LIRTLDANTLDALDETLRTEVRRQLPHGDLSITGNYRLLLSTQRSLISTMRQSLFTTSILMAIAFVLFLRSLTLSLAALIPNVFPVAINYTVMQVLGIPLDLGTAMTGAIALGIAVDNTFHFIEGWRRNGAEATAAATGRAMLVTSMVIGAGFLSLVLSDFGPTRNFGMLTSIVMVSALFGDMCVLTPLLDLVSRSRK
jgi:predicted RND superfamily exporter protein